MSSGSLFLVLLGLLAMRTEQAVLKTIDLNQQVKYPCNNQAELSCAVIWRLNPMYGLLGQSENVYRLECQETINVDSSCALPPMFTFTQTKLIKARQTPQTVRDLEFYKTRGDFIEMGCPPTQTAVCLSLSGQGYKLKTEHYILNLRTSLTMRLMLQRQFWNSGMMIRKV